MSAFVMAKPHPTVNTLKKIKRSKWIALNRYSTHNRRRGLTDVQISDPSDNIFGYESRARGIGSGIK